MLTSIIFLLIFNKYDVYSSSRYKNYEIMRLECTIEHSTQAIQFLILTIYNKVNRKY